MKRKAKSAKNRKAHLNHSSKWKNIHKFLVFYSFILYACTMRQTHMRAVQLMWRKRAQEIRMEMIGIAKCSVTFCWPNTLSCSLSLSPAYERYTYFVAYMFDFSQLIFDLLISVFGVLECIWSNMMKIVAFNGCCPGSAPVLFTRSFNTIKFFVRAFVKLFLWLSWMRKWANVCERERERESLKNNLMLFIFVRMCLCCFFVGARTFNKCNGFFLVSTCVCRTT